MVLCLGFHIAAAPLAASQAPVGGELGMVVSAQHLATRVGVDVLKQGGNAVDAAVAVGYALAVVYPAAGNLGGGGFMTLQLADRSQHFIDFRETAPLAARPDMYLGPDGEPVPGRSTLGHLAVAVPGTVAGLELAQRRFGRLDRRSLVAPAIHLARHGFVLEAGDVALLAMDAEVLRADQAAAAIFLKQGRAWQIGERLVQTDLARTLEAISAKGAAGFYQGWVSRALVEANRRGGGIIEQADLNRYRPRELEPLRCQYRGYQIVSAPPPSSGGLVLCQMLQLLEGYPLRELGFRSAQAVHLQVEAMRHAFVDRNHFLGDPAFVDNPLARLLSPEHVQRIRAAIDPARAGNSIQIRPGVPPHEGSHTTHYSIIDRWGNAVAVTYTLNDWFGAKVVAAGTGVLLNNLMDDFSSKPGRANLQGLVQGEANAIAPGKRPLSSMTPTIVTREGRPVAVLGSPGSAYIITGVLHTLLNLIDYDMDVQEAVDAPRFHHQWLPDLIQAEKHSFSPDTLRMLEAMGHRIATERAPGHVAAILVGAPALNGKPVGRMRFYGANDPRRRTGLALGY